MSSLIPFLPFFFLVFLFLSSAALSSISAADAPLSPSNNPQNSKLVKLSKLSMKAASNDDPQPEPTALPAEYNGPTTTAYVRLALTVKQQKAEKLVTPNNQGNLRKKIRTIVATALGRPAEGLNITMTIEDIEGTNPNKINPKVLLIILVGIPSVALTDTSITTSAATASDSNSAFYSQLMTETGAESITVQTTYGFPPSSSGNPFTSSDDSLFNAYKTLILSVSISIIGVLLLGAIILFLTKTKERRERLLELFKFARGTRRETNQSTSTLRLNKGGKRTSARSSGRGNSTRKNNSGRAATASTITAPTQGSLSVPQATTSINDKQASEPGSQV